MIDPALIGQGGLPRSFVTYLKWDRGSAMADFILRKYGMEVPYSFEIPGVLELEPSRDWPRRVIVGILP